MSVSLAALALNAAAAVLVQGDSGACPKGDDIHAALRARLPGVIMDNASPQAAPLRQNADTFVLEVGGPAGQPRLALKDAEGNVRLRRTLRAASTDALDCAALADTVALIVERYFEEIGLPTGPAPLPKRRTPATAVTPPTDQPREEDGAAHRDPGGAAPDRGPQQKARTAWAVEAGLVGQSGRKGWGTTGGQLSATWSARGLERDGPLVSFGLGLAPNESFGWQDGAKVMEARLSRRWAEGEAGWRKAWSSSSLEAGIAGQLVWLAMRDRSFVPGRQQNAFAPALGPWAGYRFFLTKPRRDDAWRLFAQAKVGFLVNLTRHEWKAPGNTVVATTPRTFIHGILALGVAF